MNYIAKYQKRINRDTTKQLELPEGSYELLTEGGHTYVSIPSDIQLSEVPNSKDLGAVVVPVDGELQKLLTHSPHVQLINQRVKDKIAERYSITDEIELLRNAPSDEFDEYHTYAEECRQWGKEQKEALGLKVK